MTVSYKELLKQREALEQQITEARRRELTAAISQVRELVAEYGLTQQDVERVIRIHTMCKDMDEDAFEQMETAAQSIKLVASLKKLDNRPVA